MCKLTLAVFALLLAASCDEAKYSGDGKFTDAGRLEASERFVLDLGGLNLTQPNTRTYRMASLPHDTFTLGLDVIAPTSELLYETRPIRAVVRFVVLDERGRTVVDETGPLDQWVWSWGTRERTSFVYRRGSTRDVPIGGGAVQVDLTGQKADEGWGTYFKPRSTGSYVFRVEIQRGDPASGKYRAVLKARGGGWK
jgi:hypothetical protein